MPIYPGRRPKTWRVTVYANRRQKEEIVEGLYRDARRREEELRVELRTQRIAISRAEPSFSDFARRYLEAAKLHLAASTWSVRRYQIAAMVGHFGDARLSKAVAGFEGYQRAAREAGRAPRTLNLHLNVLRAMLTWGAMQTPPISVARPSAKPLPSSGKRRAHAWTRSEVRRAYAGAPARLRPMLHALLETGMRKGELLAATWAWVDFEARMLRIPTSDEWSPKTRKPREIPLSTALLETWRRRRQEPRQPIFPNEDGSRFLRFPERLWTKMLRRAGLTGGPHTTRHTYASEFLQRRPDLFLLSKVLGHSHQRTTELYAHMMPEHLAQARDVVQLAPPGQDWAKVARRR